MSDFIKSIVQGSTWKVKMSNGLVIEYWTPHIITRSKATEMLLKEANSSTNNDNPAYYPNDIDNVWSTNGGVR